MYKGVQKSTTRVCFTWLLAFVYATKRSVMQNACTEYYFWNYVNSLWDTNGLGGVRKSWRRSCNGDVFGGFPRFPTQHAIELELKIIVNLEWRVVLPSYTISSPNDFHWHRNATYKCQIFQLTITTTVDKQLCIPCPTFTLMSRKHAHVYTFDKNTFIVSYYVLHISGYKCQFHDAPNILSERNSQVVIQSLDFFLGLDN